MACDPFASNVVLAAHLTGANGGTTFTDLTGKTITAYGGVQTSTANYAPGYDSSGLFSATGDYLTIPHSTDFRFGANDFTVECLFRPSSLSVENFLFSKAFETGTAGTNQWRIYVSLSGVVVGQVSTNGSTFLSSVTGPSALVVGTWYHIVLERYAGFLRVWVNGVSGTPVSIGTSSLYGSETEVLGIGYSRYSSSYTLRGNLNHVRITKGVARYKEAVTVPSAPFISNQCTVSGEVLDDTLTPCAAVIDISDRATGTHLVRTVSDAVTGAYSTPVQSSLPVTVVRYVAPVLDPSGSPYPGTPTENAQIFDNVLPE